MTTFDPDFAATGIGRLVGALKGLNEAPSGSLDAMASTPTTDTASPTTSSSDPVPEGTAVSQGYGNGHPGIDLAVPDGTKIAAAISGTVTHAANDDPSGYGQWIEITGADGTITRYGHLSGLSVAAGATVKAGQVIGTSGGVVGETGAGNATGAHLHFEVRQGGNTVDPTPWLAGGAQVVKANPAQVTVTPVSPGVALDTGIDRLTDVFGGKASSSPNGRSTPTTTSTGQTTGADTDPAAIDAFLNATKQHESGGDYTIRNQSGLSNASGAYQFIGTTWGGYGGYSSAAEAPPAVQDAKAREMATELFNQFHSWRLVAIAWYGGPGVAAQVANGQDPGSPSGQGSYLAYGNTIQSMMGGGGG